MVPVQYWLLSSTGLDNTLAMRIAFGTGMAVTFPTVASAAYGHSKRGTVYWGAVIPMGISAVLGGLLGGTLASHLPGDILRIFFSFLVILMAVRMVFKIREYTGYDIKQGLMIHVTVGLLIGVLSGLAGIGGGIVLVPILVILLKYPMHYAIGTSSACIMFSSAGSVIAYIYNGLGVAGLPFSSIGYVDLLQWILLAVTTIPMAQVGVRYAHRIKASSLQWLFAVLMVAIGVLMLVMN